MSYLQSKKTLYVLQKESELSSLRKQLLILTSSGERRAVPCINVLDIVVHSSVNVKRGAVLLASEHNIPIHYINNRGDYYGTFCNGVATNIFLRKKQYERRSNSAFVLKLSRAIVIGKRDNQEWLLKSVQSDLSLPEVSQSSSLDSLRGYEGKIAATYWRLFSQVVKNKDFDFEVRSRRPPLNEINALLSLGYVLLSSRVISILNYIGLDPYFGFYHQDFYRRPALALDLIEEWRSIAVDKLVLNLINRRQVKKEDFVRKGEAVYLKPKARNRFIGKWFSWWRKREFYSKLYDREATLSQFCEWQCRKLSKVFTGEIDSYSSFKF